MSRQEDVTVGSRYHGPALSRASHYRQAVSRRGIGREGDVGVEVQSLEDGGMVVDVV